MLDAGCWMLRDRNRYHRVTEAQRGSPQGIAFNSEWVSRSLGAMQLRGGAMGFIVRMGHRWTRIDTDLSLGWIRVPDRDLTSDGCLAPTLCAALKVACLALLPWPNRRLASRSRFYGRDTDEVQFLRLRPVLWAYPWATNSPGLDRRRDNH